MGHKFKYGSLKQGALKTRRNGHMFSSLGGNYVRSLLTPTGGLEGEKIQGREGLPGPLLFHNPQPHSFSPHQAPKARNKTMAGGEERAMHTDVTPTPAIPLQGWARNLRFPRPSLFLPPLDRLRAKHFAVTKTYGCFVDAKRIGCHPSKEFPIMTPPE